MRKMINVYDIPGGYHFEFFKHNHAYIDVTVTFEDDKPIADVTKHTFVHDADIERYKENAKEMALMFER